MHKLCNVHMYVRHTQIHMDRNIDTTCLLLLAEKLSLVQHLIMTGKPLSDVSVSHRSFHDIISSH